RVVGADRFDADLPELAVPPGLGALVAEEARQVPELHRLRELVHAVLEVGAAHWRGAFGSQGERPPAPVLECVHLLLDDVRRLADGAREELGGLERGRLDAPVPRALEDPPRSALDRPARAVLLGQHVVRATRGLDLGSHRPASSCRNGFETRSRPSVVMPMWPGWTTVSSSNRSSSPEIERISVPWSAPGRSVRPIEPRNRTSPLKSAPSSSI